MVTIKSVSVCLSACIFAGAALAAKPGDSMKPPAITSVTLYQDRAVVVRRGEYEMTRGTNLWRFSGFSPNLQETSLRARLLDSSLGKIVNVTNWVDKHEEIQDEKVKALDEEIDKISRELEELESAKIKLDTVGQYLGQYKAQLRKAISEQTLESEPQIPTWKKAMETISERQGTCGNSLAKVVRETEKLRTKLTDAQGRLKQLENPEPRAVRVVEVQVEAVGAGKAGLEILYEMKNARWVPIYEIREDDKGNVRFLYRAGLRQNTEEDWEAVTVTLSTAEPAIAAVRPKLRPLRLATRKLSRDESKVPPTVVETRPEVPPDMSLVEAGPTLEMKVRHEATSFAFELPGTVTIPRDNRLAKVTVAAADIKEKTMFWVLPEVRKHVYRRLKASNPVPFPMLAGELQAFHRDSYVGSATMPFTPVGGTFEVSTGMDPEITVTTSVKTDPKGSNGKHVRTYVKYASIKNGKKLPVTVTVGYVIPVSEIEEAKVTLFEEEFSAKPSTYDKKKGHLLWRVEVKPGEKKTVRFKYRVSGPKGLVNRVVRPAPQSAPVPLY